MSEVTDEMEGFLASIREATGQIQAEIEIEDPEESNDELTELYEWCEEVSADTYRWADE